MSDENDNDKQSGRENNLLDIDLREETEGVQDRRALPGETVDRLGVGWVKNYREKMAPEELENSRQIRTRFSKKFTEFPYSLWMEMTKRDKERIRLDKVVRDEIGEDTYDDTWSVREGNENPALSQFPSKLCKQILRFWSKPQDKIWDPFAGHFTRPILSNYFDRDYWGQDVSEKYFSVTKQEILSRTRGGLLNDEVITDEEGVVEVDLNGNWLKLENKDSRESGNVPSEWADFTITSPPYFDIEYYGPEDEQLGKAADEDYQEFLNMLKEVMEHNYRVLKEGRYACWVVNDFRQDCMSERGLMPYHRDVMNIAEECGFTIHDVTPYKTGVSGGMFVKQLAHMEVTGKIHEYVLTFRKQNTPEWKPRGLHWDSYPREDIIDDYGEERFNEWLQDREERGLSTERWEPYA